MYDLGCTAEEPVSGIISISSPQRSSMAAMADEGARESSPSTSSSPDDAPAPGNGLGHGGGDTISEYERQRLARIRENRARLEALNLPGLSSSLFVGSSPCSSSKRPRDKATNKKSKKGSGGSREGNGDEEDDDYRPSDEGNDEEEDESGNQSSSSEEEEWATDKKRSSESGRKGKKKMFSKGSKVTKDNRKGKTRDPCSFDDNNNDNAALQQAIALSLGGLTEGSIAASKDLPSNSGLKLVDSVSSGKKDKAKMQKTTETRKKHNVVKSRVQLTEDEVIAYFFSFDEVGKGYITVRDIEKMAITHDFNWTDSEIFSMIHSFDCDGDGKLSLEDFRTIVRRCNMLQILEEH